MLKPRNSLIVLKLLPSEEKRAGAIVLPNNGDAFSEAYVVAVGPGSVQAEGGRSETFDLKQGQRVFVKAYEKRPGPAGGYAKVPAGIEYRVDNEALFMVEQMSVLAILAEPDFVAFPITGQPPFEAKAPVLGRFVATPASTLHN